MIAKNRTVLKTLGGISIFGCVSVGLTDGIGILVRQDYNPLTKSVSDLALGPTGWIQGIGLYLGGIGILACAVGLYLVLDHPWEVRLGESFLLLSGLGILFTAIFKTDLPGHIKTLPGYVHEISSVTAAISFLPVCFLVLTAIRSHTRLFVYTIAAGILAIVLEVGRGRLPAEWIYFGLHERLIGANALAWISVMAWVILIGYRENLTMRRGSARTAWTL